MHKRSTWRGTLDTAEVHGPIRTCVGCRLRAPAKQLLRVVLLESERQLSQINYVVLPDLQRVYPGRGASIHPVDACLELAERKRAFSRAFRVSGYCDTNRLSECIQQLTFFE